MHRLGVDVWRLRQPDESALVATLKQSDSVAEGAGESTLKDEQKIDEDKTPVLSGSTQTETSTFESQVDEALPSATTKDVIDSEQPLLHVQCLSVGTCVVVFRAGGENLNDMALGIGNALSKYKATVHQSVDFVWPPTNSLNLPGVSNHGGWKSARRAFYSLITRQEWTINTLIAVGSDANEVTERFRSSECEILKLDEFPTSAQSKKEVWQRIQEIS